MNYKNCRLIEKTAEVIWTDSSEAGMSFAEKKFKMTPEVRKGGVARQEKFKTRQRLFGGGLGAFTAGLPASRMIKKTRLDDAIGELMLGGKRSGKFKRALMPISIVVAGAGLGIAIIERLRKNTIKDFETASHYNLFEDYDMPSYFSSKKNRKKREENRTLFNALVKTHEGERKSKLIPEKRFMDLDPSPYRT